MTAGTRETEPPVLRVFNRGYGHLVGYLGRETGSSPGLRLHSKTQVQQQKHLNLRCDCISNSELWIKQ
jgi:hypothetical protein